MNASFAVKLPGGTGAVIVSVCSSEVDTRTASRILCSHYNSYGEATELVIMGDFDVLSPKKESCCHGVMNGEDLSDCLPETFDNYSGYERMISQYPYVNNYVFKDKVWWEVTSEGTVVKYTKLKKPKKRKPNGKTK